MQRAKNAKSEAVLKRFIPSNERRLMAYTGAALWAMTTISIVGVSFIDALAPDNVNFWRVYMGIPAMGMAVVLAVVGPRLSEAWFRPLWMFAVMLAIPVNVILLQITPATWAILINLWAMIIFVGYFATARTLVVFMILATATALTPVIFGFAANEQQHTIARLTVYLPVAWILAYVLFAQKVTFERVLRATRTKIRLDPLTGAANVRALHEASRHVLQNPPDGTTTGVLLIDIDNFKQANTVHGHLGGDHVLAAVTKQLLRVAGKRHLVTRIGGDEFVVLAPCASRADMGVAAGLYRGAVVGASIDLDLEGVDLDASVGMAVHPDDGATLDELLTAADTSMYEVKAARHAAEAAQVSAGEPAERRSANGTARIAGGTGRLSLVPLEGFGQSLAAAETENDSEAAANTPGRRLRAWFDSRARWGRFAGIGWLTGSLLVLVSLQMPDADKTHIELATALAIAGVGCAIVLFALAPNLGMRMHVLADVICLTAIMSEVYLTGGAESQALVLVALYIAYQSWFFRSQMLGFRIVAPMAIIWAPLLYQDVFAGGEAILNFAFLYSLAAVSLMLIGTSYVNEHSIDRMRATARSMAHTDPLTGVPNRRAFEYAVERELAAVAGGESDDLAIVMIDLDNFKDVNTLHGHQAGDRLLVQIAGALRDSARQDECVARVGGDEFAVVLPGAGVEAAHALAERFIAAVAAVTAGTSLAVRATVTASAGCALHSVHGDTIDELIAAADAALMSVKSDGKAGVRAIAAIAG